MAPIPKQPPLPQIPGIKEMLNSCPDLKQADIDHLQDWMRKQPHLPSIPDDQVAPFLHANYYSLEKTKKMIENCFTIRTHAPELFQKTDTQLPVMQKQLRVFECGILDKKDINGYTIMVGRLLSGDASEIIFDVDVKLSYIAIDQLIREQPMCPGHTIILDCRGVTMSHVTRANPSSVKKGLLYAQDGLNMRLKEVHIIHMTPLIEYIMTILKPFMRGEFLSMLRFHSGQMEEFYKQFPRDILPKEFGGTHVEMAELHGKMAPIPSIPTLDELLQDSPELKRADLDHLQGWMKKQPHLPSLPDVELVPFIHASHYSLERAKKMINSYFTIRTHAPELFQNVDPLLPELQKQIRVCEFGLLSKKDSKGYTIAFVRALSVDSSEYIFDLVCKVSSMACAQITRELPTCPGFVVLLDSRRLTTGHIARASISSIKKFLLYIQEGLNLRLQAVHVLYVTPLIDYVVTLVKPFIRGDLMSVVHFHSGEMEEFYKEFPKEIIPKEFGGTAENTSDLHEDAIRNMTGSRDWHIAHSKLLVDESRRPGKAKSAGDVFGVEGSFKKLDID